MKRLYAAVLFDLDGTLADTREFLVSAYNHVLSQAGRPPITVSAVSAFRGNTIGANYRTLFPGKTSEEYDSLMSAHRAFQFAHPELIRGFPGAIEVLQVIRGAGYPIGIVTNRGPQTTPLILKHLQLEGLVDAVVVEGESSEKKPHPEPFLMCKGKLGLSRDAVCLVVGDAPVDVVGGHAAGCRVARAMWGHGASERCDEEPEFSPQSLFELPSILGLQPPAGGAGL